eukprot:9401331-Alexandrium_andersonii.AAC.1
MPEPELEPEPEPELSLLTSLCFRLSGTVARPVRSRDVPTRQHICQRLTPTSKHTRGWGDHI